MTQEPKTSAPPRFGRQLGIYFVVVVLCYTAAVITFWPADDQPPDDLVFLAIMFAPTVGAILAHFLAGGTIQWGRPNWWILAALLPVVVALAFSTLATAFGWVREDSDVLLAALSAAPLSILLASLSAIGEEIGWRGFLWPTLRSRYAFVRTSLLVFVVWWAYHVPVIFFGWYGSLAGLAAFTVAIFGFTLFVGVLTDRSRSLWPSVIGHGAWNGLVATSFAATEGAQEVPAFAGSDQLLGEFGWLAALAALLVGSLATWWHLRNPMPESDRGASDSAPSPDTPTAEDVTEGPA